MLTELAKFLLKPCVSKEAWHALKRACTLVKSLLIADDLVELAKLYGTDKWGNHWYAQHYQTHFGRLRKRPVSVLEVGVGGYADPTAGGESLKMWKRFFPRGRIYGIDIYDKSALEERRIRMFRGDQADPQFLRRVVEKIGRLDIVIDDGSHRNPDVITSFETLFPLLADGGVYAIEDVQTSYWPEFGGAEDPDDPGTTMARIKKLVDGLNYEEYLVGQYVPTYYD